jgi:ferredoxin
MPDAITTACDRVALTRAGLSQLLETLRGDGFRLVGPTVRDAAIVYDTIESIEDLPRGWTDEQGPAHYRLRRRDDDALFGYAVGPHSWKRFVHPSRLLLTSAWRTPDGFAFAAPDGKPERLALIGVRPCDVRALAILDTVLLGGAYPDAGYRARREALFVAAAQCTDPGGTCFCASMGTGPRAAAGFDVALTELAGPARDGARAFVVEVASDRGRDLLARLPAAEATADEAAAAARRVDDAAQRMGRAVDLDGVRDLLYASVRSPRWDAAGARCLACANCTLVCPTCFCTTVEDVTDLSGESAERWRSWDSCFSLDFSLIHGGSVRRSARARYRHWLTHKLATWQDQFGSAGCVGCGRCITWCPAGIDMTEEVRAIREGAAGGAAAAASPERGDGPATH